MGGLLDGIIEEVFANLLLTPVGFVYLWLRYRNQVQVKEALAKEYGSSYANAGSAVFTNILVAVGIALVLFLMIAPLLHWLKI